MSPQRPREHVLEGLSRRAFEAALPAEWVVRAVEDDYGIDREVEIFLDGRATGLMFKVQLKASDRVSRSGPSHRVTTDQVAYWKSLDVPVLIVYWVVETQSLYGRWAHTLGREPGLGRGAATATVAYGDQDLLVEGVDRIVSDVLIVRGLRAGRLPQPLALRVRIDDSFTDSSQAEAVVRLRSLVRSRSLGSVVEVLPASSDGHRPEFLVHLSGGRSTVLRASLPIDIASVRVAMPADAYDHHDDAALHTLASDMLVAMAVALQRTGARAPAARLLDRVARESKIAAVHYNVAKILGSTGERQVMLPELDAALTHDPGYQDRGYFFRERDGVRWHVGDHLGAAEDYDRALQLGADAAELQPLLINTLMWAGHYSEAAETSAGWSPSGHRTDRLAVLDGIALEELERTLGLAQQDRRPADPESIERASEDVGRCTELLRETDALDPRIWIHLVQGERPPAPRLILLALVCEDLVLPWAMATVATFVAEDASSTFLHVVASAIERTEQNACVATAEEVAGDALDAPSAARLRAAVYEHIASMSDQRTLITTRVIEDTGLG